MQYLFDSIRPSCVGFDEDFDAEKLTKYCLCMVAHV